MKEFSTTYSDEDIKRRISSLRISGRLSEAIALCKKSQKKHSDSGFYSKILGDLYFQMDEYNSAAESYLVFLNHIKPYTKQFGDFAKRYYRLKRAWSEQKTSAFAERILEEIQSGRFAPQIVSWSNELIKADVKKKVAVSIEGQRVIDCLDDDNRFNEFVKHVKDLEIKNTSGLEYFLDEYILDRNRDIKYIRIDSYCITTYEKLEKYEKAVKLAKELLPLRFDSVIVRTVFRICRKRKNYNQANILIDRYPELLKSSDFNILFELVYYYETQDQIERVQTTLQIMERKSLQSIPIQKTVRNFYLSFGLLNDAERVEKNIQQLQSSKKRVNDRFSDEIKESEAEIGSKISELYSKLEHQKQLAAISDLTTGISHELGQPITNIRYTIQFYSKLFKNNVTNEDVLRVFDSILEETKRMGSLVKRLSPLISSRNVIESFDLVERIHKRFRAESAKLEELNIEVRITPNAPVFLIGDPVHCDQLFSNLLLNSIDAVKQRKGKKENNQIDVNLSERKDSVKIDFSDTGIGIPAKHRGKIFDPFFSTKDPGKGEGLGLFIIWNLMKMQGGKIFLDSKYKRGARFVITMPKETKYKRSIGNE